MKTLKYLTAAGLLAAAAAAVATEGSSVISEQAGAKNSTVTADVAVQAPTPAVKQKTALSPEEWQRVLAAMPKAEVMNGFAVHSKQFCASCHGKEGIADTPNWPDVAGQPYAVTVKALLDYRNGRRKGTPASDLMSAAAAKLTDQQIADVAALYEYLPGRNAKKAAPTTPAPELVNSGDASRYITPCAACHGIDAPRQQQRTGAGASRPAGNGSCRRTQGLPLGSKTVRHARRNARFQPQAHGR